MRKRLLTMVMLFVMAMVSIPCIGEMTGGKFGTVEAEAATKAATNKKAKALYQKKINQLRKSVGGLNYKYADVNRDGITDVMIEYEKRTNDRYVDAVTIELTFLIYTYKQGKLVKLLKWDYLGYDYVDLKVIGYKGGVILHLDDWEGESYYYFKKSSAGKYKLVAEKYRGDEGYGKWSYYEIKGSSWKESQRLFDKQVKNVKTGTRKYYGDCSDWKYMGPV